MFKYKQSYILTTSLCNMKGAIAPIVKTKDFLDL